MKNHRVGIIAATFSLLALFNVQARASYVTGDIAVSLDGTSTYTGSSLSSAGTLTLAPGVVLSQGTGDLASVPVFQFAPPPVPTSLLPIFAATSTMSAYVSDSVPDLFVFENAGDTQQYDFNLSSLAEEYVGGNQLELFGKGTLVDSSGLESTSPASFTLNGLTDSGGGNAISGSFTLSTSAPVPEPATAGLMVAGGLGLLRRRRRV